MPTVEERREGSAVNHKRALSAEIRSVLRFIFPPGRKKVDFTKASFNGILDDVAEEHFSWAVAGILRIKTRLVIVKSPIPIETEVPCNQLSIQCQAVKPDCAVADKFLHHILIKPAIVFVQKEAPHAFRNKLGNVQIHKLRQHGEAVGNRRETAVLKLSL